MSNMMAPPQRDPIRDTMSALNGPDMALKMKSGEIGSDPSFGEVMEQGFGIKWDDPMSVAKQKMAKNAQNATPMGKSQSMAAGPQNQVPGMPQRPQPAGRPMAAQGGLESLMGR